jgi:transcriptional regulator with XRE-family HTH domain
MIGKQFKDARESLGLSQDELAEVLGLSGKQAVSNIETGLRNPSTLVAAVLVLLAELPDKKSKELQSALRDTVARISKSKRRAR